MRQADLEGVHIETINSRLAAIADQQWQDLVLTREYVTTSHALLQTTLARLGRAECRPRSNPKQQPKLTARAQTMLASAYEIPAVAVAAEAEALANWSLPFDDLIAQICRLHGWKAELGAVYIGALRSALLGHEPGSPWLNE